MRKATKTKQQLKRREETELIKSENIEGPTRWPRNRKKILTLIVRNTRGGSRWGDGLLRCHIELLNIIFN
jgi:hypothetical protein